jgi:hypothetical protein
MRIRKRFLIWRLKKSTPFHWTTFVGAKSTADLLPRAFEMRNANGDFHVAVPFDQVAPLIPRSRLN